MLNVHIHKPIEFEKITIENTNQAINLTRQRMSIQQMLDAKDLSQNLINRLNKYIENYDNFLMSLDPVQPLINQPIFEWSIQHEILETSCWKLEPIISRVVLSECLIQQATEKIIGHDFKEASRLYGLAIQTHMSSISNILEWKWKLPNMNHHILQDKWHKAMVYHLKSLKSLCMLSVALEKDSPASTLYTVSQRVIKNSAKAIIEWPSMESNLKLGESLRYLFSSHILWNKEQYGSSIYRLQSWLEKNTIPCGHFDVIKQEFEKIPFLLKERIQANNGAYFDAIKPATALPSPSELIHSQSNDVPHPQLTQHNSTADALVEHRDSLKVPLNR